MVSIVNQLAMSQQLTPKYPFVVQPIYEVVMGSTAYGASLDNSDIDIYAVCVPSKKMLFHGLNCDIIGFGHAPETFDVYQKHHIPFNAREYDVAIYSIVKYFNLCAEANPNMIDSLFVPDRCILFSSDAGKHFRHNRKLFLSKKIFQKMRGYAFSEFKKIERGYNPKTGSNREQSVKEYGYDVKSAYHIVRLLLEAEMILDTGDLVLDQNGQHLKFVKQGGYTYEEFKEYFLNKEAALDLVYARSKIPNEVDMKKIEQVLWQCLEQHYGSLSNLVNNSGIEASVVLQQIKELVKNI